MHHPSGPFVEQLIYQRKNNNLKSIVWQKIYKNNIYRSLKRLLFTSLIAFFLLPLMLFIWALDTKKPELTDIEVTAGVGKRLLLFTKFHHQQFGGGVWLKELTFYSHFCSVFLLPTSQKKEQTKDVARGGLMRLFTPFTIPQKENCDLCRIEKNKKKAVKNPFLDNLFENLYRQRFDYVFD